MSGGAVLMIDARATSTRHAQIARLCARLGLDIEYILMPGAKLPEDTVEAAIRFGVIPSSTVEDSSTASAFFAAFTAGRDCRLIYESGASARLPGGVAGSVRLVEAATMDAEAVPAGVLALEQTPGGAARASRSASHVAFLPPPLPPLPRPCLGRGTYVGWEGRWDRGLAAAWAELGCALRDCRAALPGGVLLAGEGVESLWLPSEVAPVLRVPDGGRLDATRRALGLAVLPVSDLEPYASDLARLLGAGVPVLTLADCATRFKDAWRLPVADDIEALAKRVAAVSLPSGALDYATGATLRAFEARLRNAEDALVAQLSRRLARNAASRR